MQKYIFSCLLPCVGFSEIGDWVWCKTKKKDIKKIITVSLKIGLEITKSKTVILKTILEYVVSKTIFLKIVLEF